MPVTSCPKCKGAMEEGFIKDEGYGTVHAGKWVEGPPEKSFWTGTKTHGRNQVQVLTYRCADCGYLESYAR
jgi:formate-dependent nitrite reductase cytochrome c552 subunit